MNSHNFLTIAFYKFVELSDIEARRAPLLAFCEQQGVKGLILLAKEGINSTIAGPEDAIRAVLAYLRADPKFADLQPKESWSELAPFRRMRVRLKKEIVTSGVPEVSPSTMAGTYVKPEDWNALISDPAVVLIDTRNDYEVELGTFERAIDPKVQTFSQLPGWVNEADVLKAVDGKRPKVAMFCTGGIRCEKSTAMMRAKGYDEVYHLEGGILKYLETVAPEESLWRGECFVFDERVAVTHGLQRGESRLCRCCRQPFPLSAVESDKFELGVSCPRCFDRTTPEQKNTARERQRQCELADARKKQHIGAKMPLHQQR
jgi:UPF0176 protein